MKDSALLELAARAAGIEGPIAGEWAPGQTALIEGIWLGGHDYWNPLAHDADAKELASRLDLQVSAMNDVAGAAGNVRVGTRDSQVAVHESYLPGGKQAAIRRAITRAAAEVSLLA